MTIISTQNADDFFSYVQVAFDLTILKFGSLSTKCSISKSTLSLNWMSTRRDGWMLRYFKLWVFDSIPSLLVCPFLTWNGHKGLRTGVDLNIQDLLFAFILCLRSFSKSYSMHADDDWWLFLFVTGKLLTPCHWWHHWWLSLNKTPLMTSELIINSVSFDWCVQFFNIVVIFTSAINWLTMKLIFLTTARFELKLMLTLSFVYNFVTHSTSIHCYFIF